MSSRQQPRRLARELALLSLSQVKGNTETLSQQELNDLIIAAVKTLASEAEDCIEKAATHLTRSSEKLLSSENPTQNVEQSRELVHEALELAQNAINRLGGALDIPETVQLSSQHEVREYALLIIGTVSRRQKEIITAISEAMVDWQINRLPRIDRDILKIAVAEMMFLETPHKVAVNEAIELAKRYSDEAGYRFINGVLRRVIDHNNRRVKA